MAKQTSVVGSTFLTYFECSPRSGKMVKELFDLAIRLHNKASTDRDMWNSPTRADKYSVGYSVFFCLLFWFMCFGIRIVNILTVCHFLIVCS